MRETEFRAWLKNEKKMVIVDAIDFRQEIIFYTEEREIDGEFIDTLQTRKFNEIELMQYTGLKDKNGKKIFKGDIVGYDEKIAVVKYGYHNCGCCYDVYGFTLIDNNRVTSAVYFEYCKVIGNIYENPELLEVN